MGRDWAAELVAGVGSVLDKTIDAAFFLVAFLKKSCAGGDVFYKNKVEEEDKKRYRVGRGLLGLLVAFPSN